MEKLLVVVFNDEPKTYEGSHALKQLDNEGSISIHAEAVIKKNADGTITIKQSEDDFPIRTVGGTAIGSLIGLLEGPVGLAVGATAGLLAGSIGDLHVAGVDAEFVDEVAATLTPGKCAVIAESARSGLLRWIPEWKPWAEPSCAKPKDSSRTTNGLEMWRSSARKSIN